MYNKIFSVKTTYDWAVCQIYCCNGLWCICNLCPYFETKSCEEYKIFLKLILGTNIRISKQKHCNECGFNTHLYKNSSMKKFNDKYQPSKNNKKVNLLLVKFLLSQTFGFMIWMLLITWLQISSILQHITIFFCPMKFHLLAK